MSHDHIRNALVIMFVLSLATLAQNFRMGYLLDQAMNTNKRDNSIVRNVPSHSQWAQLYTAVSSSQCTKGGD